MPRFAANLSLLWTELPYRDRFAAAARAGFDAVEILFPYDLPAERTAEALAENGQRLVLINAPPPAEEPRTRGFAAVPGTEDAFRRDMQHVFSYAEVLGPRFIHVMTGDAEGDAARDTLLGNLEWAVAQAPSGLTLTLEPLNPVSMPGYYLDDYAKAAEMIRRIDAPNLRLQYDCFHAQMIHGDALKVFDTYTDLIAHIQIGDSPHRGPPGSGTVDFPALFGRIAASGYDGWISAEYHPGTATEQTLDWMTPA
jgi:hydroxypyruvate isomerase